MDHAMVQIIYDACQFHVKEIYQYPIFHFELTKAIRDYERL